MSTSIYTQKSHYVYRITNILENKHYYGSRSCKCDPQDDLGIKYFSSSFDNEFLQEQKKCPEHFKYKIVRIYDIKEKALELEILLHEKFDVGVNDAFYNRSKQTSIGWSRVGITHSEETRKKISERKKGENHPNFSGYYHTPFGIFTSSSGQNILHYATLRKWCKNNTKVISKMSYVRTQYLQENFDDSIIGKTYEELGFWFENAANTILQGHGATYILDHR